MSYVGKITDTSGNTGLVGSTLYGTCSTGASTAAKVVTCADFDKLLTGVTIHVKFTYQNSNTATLNVNNTGAKSIKVGSRTVDNMTLTKHPRWNAGQVVSFTYDGTNWCLNEYFEYNTDTNDAVTQTATSTNADYEVLFSGTADNTTRTEGARKDSNLLYNPSSNTLGLKNTGISNSITPSSISLSNSSGGGISIDNTNNKIEVGKSGTSITYSNTDIVTSNGNTWDGTNTSLKSALAAAVGTDEKVTQTESTTDAEYEITFAGSTGTTTTTEGVGKSQYLTFNPYDCVLTTTDGSSGWTSNLTGYDINLTGTDNTWDGTNTSLKSAISSLNSRLGNIAIKAGTKILTGTSSVNYLKIFTNAELNTLFGASDCSNTTCVVLAMNGDYNAQNKYVTATVYENGNWYFRTYDNASMLSGPYRVNYIAIKFA